jgi:hypothetical protein
MTGASATVASTAQRWVPRDFWLELWEKEAIIDFHLKNPLEGYRRLTFMMLDADVVAVRPESVSRVLKQAGLLSRWKAKPSRKGECHRLYHAEGYVGRTPAGDSGQPGSEIGSGERTPEESPPAGRVIDETDYFRVADNIAGNVRGWTAAFAGSLKAVTESLRYGLIPNSSVNGIRCRVAQVSVENAPIPTAAKMFRQSMNAGCRIAVPSLLG